MVVPGRSLPVIIWIRLSDEDGCKNGQKCTSTFLHFVLCRPSFHSPSSAFKFVFYVKLSSSFDLNYLGQLGSCPHSPSNGVCPYATDLFCGERSINYLPIFSECLPSKFLIHPGFRVVYLDENLLYSTRREQ